MTGVIGALLADLLVVLGLVVMTVAVYGAIRMPDIYTRLHATSKAVFLGVISFCVASIVTGDGAIIARVLLIAVFLVITTPVSAHAIARAAYLRREPMESSDALDESGHGLVADPAPRAAPRTRKGRPMRGAQED